MDLLQIVHSLTRLSSKQVSVSGDELPRARRWDRGPQKGGATARRGGQKGGADFFLFLFSVVVGGADQPAPENIDVDVDCLAAGSPDFLASDRPAARRCSSMSPRSIKHTRTHTKISRIASHRIHLPLWTSWTPRPVSEQGPEMITGQGDH